MSKIDEILSDIDKKIECCSDWHVEIVSNTRVDEVQAKKAYLWNAESPAAAEAIKEYLIALGMNDGNLAEPKGSFIYIVNLKQHN